MNSRPLRFLAFSGSLRKGSWNHALLRNAAELLPSETHMDFARLDDIPLYNEDVLAAGGYPEPVQRLRAQAKAADAFVIATPEYNYSVPGMLKNALDWASRRPDQPFDGKCAAIVGASRSQMGTSRAQYHLRMILGAINVTVVNHPEVTMAAAPDKLTVEGILTDPAERDRLQKLMANLAELTRRLSKS